jgi:hypothetical protein
MSSAGIRKAPTGGPIPITACGTFFPPRETMIMGTKILRQFTESLWIAFLITCQLMACQKFFWHRQERMQSGGGWHCPL